MTEKSSTDLERWENEFGHIEEQYMPAIKAPAPPKGETFKRRDQLKYGQGKVITTKKHYSHPSPSKATNRPGETVSGPLPPNEEALELIQAAGEAAILNADDAQVDPPTN